MRRLLPFLLVACTGRPELPSRPPVDHSARNAGLKAVADCAASQYGEISIAVAAEPTETANGAGIRFTVKNVSAHSLRFYPYYMPWENLNAAQLSAVTLSGEVLPTFWPVIDPAPESIVTLAPGQSLSGDLVLSYRIEHLEQARAREPVLVSWCYSLRPLGENASHSTSGVLTIPKRAV